MRGSPLRHRCACDLPLIEAEVTEDLQRAFVRSSRAHVYSRRIVTMTEHIASVIKTLARDLVVRAQKEDSRTL